jgi:hypothetical protein
MAEQIQLSYINTTDSGINMIVSWLRFNGSQPINFHELTTNQYNTYYPKLGLMLLAYLMCCGYLSFNLCKRTTSHDEYKILPGPNGTSKKYATNHWKIIKTKKGPCFIFSGAFLFFLTLMGIISTGFIFPLHKTVD